MGKREIAEAIPYGMEKRLGDRDRKQYTLSTVFLSEVTTGYGDKNYKIPG